MKKSRRRLLLFAVLVCLVLALAVPVVSGHAYLEESDPANGEQLDTLPDEIELSFSGDGVERAAVDVTGPDGEAVGDAAVVDEGESQLVRVPLSTPEDASEGMYVVEWEVLADDGHTTSGSFFFTVGDGPVDRDAVIDAHEADADEGIAWVEAGGKALLLIGLVGTIGIGAVATAVVYPVIDRHGRARLGAAVDHRLRRAVAGSSLALFAGLLLFGGARIAQRGGLTPETAVDFLGTSIGEIWLAQTVVALTIVVISLLALRGLVNQLIWLTAAVGGGPLVAFGVAWNSHSATAIDFGQGLAVDFIHLLGASLWIGGLVVLWLFTSAVASRVDDAEQVPLVAGVVRRFSLVAITGVTLVVSTGLVLADWHVGSSGALTETQYGLILSLKLLVIGIALALGGYNHLILRRRLDPTATGLLDTLFGRRPARTDGGEATDEGAADEPNSQGHAVALLAKSVRLELVVLLVVVVLSALLTSAATAAVVVDQQGEEIEIQTSTEELEDGVTAELTALPAYDVDSDRFVFAETDVIVFEATFTQDGEPLQSDRPVELLATTSDGETQFEVELSEDNKTYSTMQAFPAHGDWEIRLTGEPTDSLETVWFETYVMPDIDDHLLGHTDHAHDDHNGEDDTGHDHENGHDHDDEHDHGADDHENGHDHDDDHGSPLDSPLQLAGLLVFIYGGLWVGYEANSLRQHES